MNIPKSITSQKIKTLLPALLLLINTSCKDGVDVITPENKYDKLKTSLELLKNQKTWAGLSGLSITDQPATMLKNSSLVDAVSTNINSKLSEEIQEIYKKFLADNTIAPNQTGIDKLNSLMVDAIDDLSLKHILTNAKQWINDNSREIIILHVDSKTKENYIKKFELDPVKHKNIQFPRFIDGKYCDVIISNPVLFSEEELLASTILMQQYLTLYTQNNGYNIADYRNPVWYMTAEGGDTIIWQYGRSLKLGNTAFFTILLWNGKEYDMKQVGTDKIWLYEYKTDRNYTWEPFLTIKRERPNVPFRLTSLAAGNESPTTMSYPVSKDGTIKLIVNGSEVSTNNPLNIKTVKAFVDESTGQKVEKKLYDIDALRSVAKKTKLESIDTTKQIVDILKKQSEWQTINASEQALLDKYPSATAMIKSL